MVFKGHSVKKSQGFNTRNIWSQITSSREKRVMAAILILASCEVAPDLKRKVCGAAEGGKGQSSALPGAAERPCTDWGRLQTKRHAN